MNPKPLGAHGTAWIAVTMAWCAGFVDIASYFELRHVYTSHMTGNTASLASRLLEGSWQEVARYGWAIGAFMIGLLVSASLTHVERRHGIRSAFAAVLTLEVALLLAFVVLGRYPATAGALLIFLPAAAMGAQTVTVTRVGPLRVYTTYLTGSLSKLSESLTEYLFWFWDRTKGRFRKRIGKVLRVTPRRQSAQQVALTAGLWLAFFGGGLTGFEGDRACGLLALLFPMALLAVIIGVDLRCPVALGEVSDDEVRRHGTTPCALR